MRDEPTPPEADADTGDEGGGVSGDATGGSHAPGAAKRRGDHSAKVAGADGRELVVVADEDVISDSYTCRRVDAVLRVGLAPGAAAMEAPFFPGGLHGERPAGQETVHADRRRRDAARGGDEGRDV